jgi:hypothetical protein
MTDPCHSLTGTKALFRFETQKVKKCSETITFHALTNQNDLLLNLWKEPAFKPCMSGTWSLASQFLDYGRYINDQLYWPLILAVCPAVSYLTDDAPHSFRPRQR